METGAGTSTQTQDERGCDYRSTHTAMHLDRARHSTHHGNNHKHIAEEKCKHRQDRAFIHRDNSDSAAGTSIRHKRITHLELTP
jgi:hypothetical protein